MRDILSNLPAFQDLNGIKNESLLNPLASEDEDEAEIEAEFENLMNEVKFSIHFRLLRLHKKFRE